MTGLNVLFYEDPLTDQAAFFWRAPHIGCDAPWLRALAAAGCDARMLVHARFAARAAAAGIDPAELIVVDEDAIVAALPDPQLNVNTLFHRWHEREAAAGETQAALADRVAGTLATLIGAALGGFVPDVIVTWVPVPHLRALFPDALILHKETSIVSRAPYPIFYYLDPLGFHDRSALAAIPVLAPTATALAAFDGIRQAFAAALDLASPAIDLADLRARYASLLLVASHTNGVFFFDGACAYRSQSHMLLDVLEHAPADCGVIVTQHPDCPWLSPPEIAYLRERHPNLIDPASLPIRSSQPLLRQVDAVATVSSSIGLQTLLWDTPLLALGSSHLNRFAAADDAARIGAVLAARPFRSVDAAWLLFHYSYLNEAVTAPGWLARHFAERLDHWRRQGADGYFAAPVADPRETAGAARAIMDRDIAARFAPIGEDGAIDLRDDMVFGRGWTGAITSEHGAHRWIAGTEGELLLPLDGTVDHAITIQLGPLAGIEGQSVTLGVGDQVLATSPIGLNLAIDLNATLPAALAGRGITRLWLRAARADRPAPDGAPLSLITGRIGVRALRPG